MIATPIEQVAETDIPSQVDKQIAIAQVLGESFTEVSGRDLELPIVDATQYRSGDFLSIVPTFNYRHRGWLEIELPE
jgi:hypothetical protein